MSFIWLKAQMYFRWEKSSKCHLIIFIPLESVGHSPYSSELSLLFSLLYIHHITLNYPSEEINPAKGQFVHSHFGGLGAYHLVDLQVEDSDQAAHFAAASNMLALIC